MSAEQTQAEATATADEDSIAEGGAAVADDDDEKEFVLEYNVPRNLDGSTKVRKEYGHYGTNLHEYGGRNMWFIYNWELLNKRFEAKHPGISISGRRRLKMINPFDNDSRLEMMISDEFSRFINDELEVYRNRRLLSYEARSNGFKTRKNYLENRDHPEPGDGIASNDQRDGTVDTLKRVVKRVKYVDPSDSEDE